jgi:hypothetical protein
MGLPLEFVTFAYMEGKMYRHWQNKGTFAASEGKNRWGNTIIYGALYLLRDFHFYIRTLDAYYLCSMSALHKNHVKDYMHRVTTQAIPISFQSVEQFQSLRYTEKEPQTVVAYLGNTKHPKINQRIYAPSKKYRIVQGIDVPNFTQLLREVYP